MSGFVLILSPRDGGWPAVIGGYGDRDGATEAGREATMAHITEQMFEDEGYGLSGESERRAELCAWAARPWRTFTVIPGSA